jgi:hypothetical protein
MAKSSARKSEKAPAKLTTELRIFGNKPFMRFVKKFGASDRDLSDAAKHEPDADLGGGVFKFRLAREGEGPSGGARLIVAMRRSDRVVMMFGFEKKDLSNINFKELKAFKKLAKVYLERSERDMDTLVKSGELVEIKALPTQESLGKSNVQDKIAAIEAKECEHGESSKRVNEEGIHKESRD